ncbi:50S ribosomal protein L15 [Tunicatimonas pelagia]|uniref:50S ribosomal protein L15 n=1 Tax=Tunicatimonas pelagia TaxID=931531 RepID=UPI0026671E02|nr:50S ribosomal protein L15 [Tunicatimonas pelagia]WKN42272.1 50S ribosomal protein L15 [Tunicatimonas pelagia]
MNLSNLKPAEGSVKNKKRIGRGAGSGWGGTAGRGHKGAQSRSGYKVKAGFEGGQMPLQRRVPKFGFKSPNRVVYHVVNVGQLQGVVDKLGKSELSFQDFVSVGLAGKKDLVKILGDGEISASVKVEAHAFSKSAKEAIEKAGGETVKL